MLVYNHLLLFYILARLHLHTLKCRLNNNIYLLLFALSLFLDRIFPNIIHFLDIFRISLPFWSHNF